MVQYIFKPKWREQKLLETSMVFSITFSLLSPPLSTTLLLIFVGCLFFYTIIIISISIILLQHWFASCSFSFSFFLLFSQQYYFNNCFYAVSNEGREEKKTVDRMADLAQRVGVVHCTVHLLLGIFLHLSTTIGVDRLRLAAAVAFEFKQKII